MSADDAGDRILVVANAQAGSAQQERLDAALAVLRREADVELARPADVTELGEVLGHLDGRRLVVAGGDGSMHVVVRELWRRGAAELAQATLGLVPLGTGNDLATGLELPEDPAAAARLCLHGQVRTLDLITTNSGEVVVNASHAGLGAAAAERSEGMKAALGPLAYPAGAVAAGVQEAAWDLRVSLDGQVVHEGATLMVGVANAPSIGGGTRLCPPALPDDGQLDLIVVSAVGPAARLAFATALRDEAHLDRDDVLHVLGREATIAGEPVAHDLDGELTEDLDSCTYTIQPSAWRLLVSPAGEQD